LIDVEAEAFTWLIVGVAIVGDVPKTSEPEPVSSVTADAKFAEEGVPKNVAMPVPSPETPVEMGSPVQFVSVPEVGVPRMGVVNEGEVVMATLPEPEIVYSPRTPPLSKSTFVVVPDAIVVEPTVRGMALVA
jgi:hypothetical protein